jgi:hypothetical protein
MHAYLITGGSPLSRQKKIDELATSWSASPFDLRDLTTPEGQPSIVVENIRDFTRALSFSGIESHPLIGIIRDAHLMTPQAQGALLKTLEEPPGQVKIIMETQSADTLLPTIISRTIPILLDTTSSEQKEECPVSYGTVIQKAQEVGKSKVDGKKYLTDVMSTVHTSWKTHPDKISAGKLKKCIEGIKMLSVNVSPQSAIEFALFPS